MPRPARRSPHGRPSRRLRARSRARPRRRRASPDRAVDAAGGHDLVADPTLGISARCAAIWRRCGRHYQEEEPADEDDEIDDDDQGEPFRRPIDRSSGARASRAGPPRPRRPSRAGRRLRSLRRRGSGGDSAPPGAARPRCAYAAGVATRPRGRAQEQTLLEQERLVDVLDGLGLLGDGDRQRAQPDRLAAERLAQRREDRPVDLVEPELVDLEQRERGRVRSRRRRCRRRAPRRSRGRASAAGSRCGACRGLGARSRPRHRA